MVFELTGNSNVCSTVYSDDEIRDIKALYKWPFVIGGSHHNVENMPMSWRYQGFLKQHIAK